MRKRAAPIRKTGIVRIASRIPRYVEPHTTYTTSSAAQIRAAETPPAFTPRLPGVAAGPPAPPVTVVEIPVGERGRQEAEADDERDYEHTCHNESIVPSVSPLAQVVLSFISIMQADGWLGLELRHLLALRAVAEEGSFGRAATR